MCCFRHVLKIWQIEENTRKINWRTKKKNQHHNFAEKYKSELIVARCDVTTSQLINLVVGSTVVYLQLQCLCAQLEIVDVLRPVHIHGF